MDAKSDDFYFKVFHKFFSVPLGTVKNFGEVWDKKGGLGAMAYIAVSLIELLRITPVKLAKRQV